MKPRALERKLLRELWQLRGQMLSIALVVAAGILAVITMRGAYDALLDARDDYYSRARFADLWAPLRRAPDALAERLAAVPGVAALDTRVSFLATLDLDGVAMPALGRFVSLPVPQRPLLNDLHISLGRYPQAGAADEVLISAKFAAARGLRPGDQLRVLINGRSRALDIVGVATSPEHSFAVPPGSLLPEDERYGVFWMPREVLGPAWDLDGAFNEVVARLDPGVNPEAVLRAFDALLEPYGGLGSYLREDQLSHQVLENELAQMRVQATVIPAIFLGVAVFLLHLVLGRLIGTQRGEIAILKAFGYSNAQVGLHYLLVALLPVLAGSALGVATGAWLGEGLVRLYQEYFELPGLAYRLRPGLIGLALLASALAAGSGALAAVRGALRLPPAEAMRPPAPARFRPGPLERLGLGRLLPSAGRMILRNVERKPLQAALSALGVALSVTILVTGLFMFDSVDRLMDLQFRQIQREDLSLSFKEVESDRVRHELARLPGVSRVEVFRQVPARLRAGARREDVGVLGLAPDTRLRRIVDASGAEIPLPARGLLLSDLLARRLDVAPGDWVDVDWREGRRRSVRLQVAGVVEDFLGMSAYVDLETLRALTQDAAVISGAWLAVEEGRREALYAALKQVPAVASINSPDSMLAVFEEEMARRLLVSSAILLGFAAVIATGVIYNGARIALSERGRELASLRVMGFHRGEVAVLLLGEQALITALGLPLGAALGYGLSKALAAGFENETYRIPFVVEPSSYLGAAGVVVLAALVSGWLVRRKLDRFDLVDVLKTRE